MKDGSARKSVLLDELKGYKTRLAKLQRLEVEREQAREALRVSEAKYRQLVETANSIILQMDTRGYITFSNRFAQNFFGYSEKEMLGRHVVGTVVPKKESSGRNLVAMMKDICRHPERYSNNENENIRRNGERVWVAWTNKSILDREGCFTEILCIGNDITQRKKAEEKLLLYQEQLRSLASELSLLEEKERRRIAILLHDGIGQILATTKIKVETLGEHPLPRCMADVLDETKDLIEQAIHNTRTLTLDLSPPILYELGFEAAVEWLLEHFNERYKIMSELENDNKYKPLEEDVRIVLFHAVKELLMNVVKHSKINTVRVSIRKNGGHIEIKVKDSGIGFDISKVCSQANKTRSFGLFSVRERLGHLGGRLMVESQPGRGTETTLFAPLKEIT